MTSTTSDTMKCWPPKDPDFVISCRGVDFHVLTKAITRGCLYVRKVVDEPHQYRFSFGEGEIRHHVMDDKDPDVLEKVLCFQHTDDFDDETDLDLENRAERAYCSQLNVIFGGGSAGADEPPPPYENITPVVPSRQYDQNRDEASTQVNGSLSGALSNLDLEHNQTIAPGADAESTSSSSASTRPERSRNIRAMKTNISVYILACELKLDLLQDLAAIKFEHQLGSIKDQDLGEEALVGVMERISDTSADLCLRLKVKRFVEEKKDAVFQYPELRSAIERNIPELETIFRSLYGTDVLGPAIDDDLYDMDASGFEDEVYDTE